ncbi:MAG: FkbM family methyltransferase [Rhodothermales bacterium]|nr:FkbM family methyltransferase [Rhodothermales bacterium]
MKDTFRSLVVAMLARQNAFPTGRIPRQDLLALVRALRPVMPAQPLVRLGGDGDGGYLVPDDLDGLTACYSPGVNDVSRFEKDCAARGMDVYMADRSVEGPAEPDPRFHFLPAYVGAFSDDGFVTLDAWVEANTPEGTGDLLLQMDIEGYEYEVLLAASEALLRRFRIVVIEFHDLDKWWSTPFFSLASRAVYKLLHTHACVHLHPNNCCGATTSDGVTVPRLMEMTFVRRDRLGMTAMRTDFPHPLDRDNTSLSTLPLPSEWYT